MFKYGLYLILHKKLGQISCLGFILYVELTLKQIWNLFCSSNVYMQIHSNEGNIIDTFMLFLIQISLTQQASTLTFVRLSGTIENWRRTSRSCITVVRRYKWKNDCPTFWRLFSILKIGCFAIFTDLNFVNNDFNVCKNTGFHWSTLSLLQGLTMRYSEYILDPYQIADIK